MRTLALLFPLIATGTAGTIGATKRQSSYGATPPRANLGYATYEGTALANGIDQYLGVRYAAPPTGKRRFRQALPPLYEKGVIGAKEHGPICYGVAGSGDSGVPFAQSEDCLFIDLYVPANATSANGNGLPVMLWLQGGAFVQLFNPNYNGTGLIEASGGNVIVATFNYRVGPYGFLANEELAEEGNLNIGLHDQRAAIRWAYQHIGAFGGDPNKITLFGTSVGGGSVPLQLVAYGGKPPASEAAVRWNAGIAQAVYMPSVYSVKEMSFHYEYLLNATNCTGLACLRSVSIDDLQAANTAIPFPGHAAAPLFGYGPVLDGTLLPDTPLQLLSQGRFAQDKPIIIGTSRTEGTIFAPQANITSDIYNFLQAQYPNLTTTSFNKLNQLYANTPTTYPGVTIPISSLFYRAAALYGDASFTCPTYDFATQLSKNGVQTYLFIDHILDPVEVVNGIIVPHTWELEAVWGPDYSTNYAALPGANSYDKGGVNAGIVPTLQAYWTSFVRSGGDVNRLRRKSTPAWGQVGGGLGRYLRLQTNATRMQTVDDELARRCQAWQSIRQEIGQ